MNQNEITKKLMKYKNEIEVAEKKENITNGEINSLNGQLKKLLATNNLNEIKEKLKLINKNLESIDKKIEIEIKELENLPEFNDFENEL